LQYFNRYIIIIKKKLCFIKKIILLLFLIIFSFAKSNVNRPFVWADDENYWPAIYRNKDGKPAGIFNDILTEVFKRLNIPLEKSVYPWKRAQKLVKEGKADGMVTVWTKERQKFTVATKPLWYIHETLFFRRDNPKACKILRINSFKELQNLILVDTIGSGWSKEQYKKHHIKNVIWVPTIDSAFNMLAKKRADIYIMFSFNAYNFLLKKKNISGNPLSKDYQEIVAITPSFAKLPFRLLIRKDSPYVKKIKAINKVLEEMKKDGTYQKIIQKYIGTIPTL